MIWLFVFDVVYEEEMMSDTARLWWNEWNMVNFLLQTCWFKDNAGWPDPQYCDGLRNAVVSKVPNIAPDVLRKMDKLFLDLDVVCIDLYALSVYMLSAASNKTYHLPFSTLQEDNVKLPVLNLAINSIYNEPNTNGVAVPVVSLQPASLRSELRYSWSWSRFERIHFVRWWKANIV